jgi:acetyltransferase-like isoleucine patch superfamily enzyme
MRALREAGLKRFWRFAWYALADVIYRVLMLPPLQTWFLRRLGARIGAETVMIDARFMSVNVNGFRHLEIGRECFLGNEVMIDLASPIAIEDRVSIASRCVILSHLNVGYRDHPLQPHFPRRFEGVRIREGSFVGASVTILPGVEIGPMAFVAAGSVVTEPVPPRVVVAGVPARVVRRLDEPGPESRSV